MNTQKKIEEKNKKDFYNWFYEKPKREAPEVFDWFKSLLSEAEEKAFEAGMFFDLTDGDPKELFQDYKNNEDGTI